MSSDDAPGAGHRDRPAERQLTGGSRIESTFGKLTAFVTDGHLPYPYGRELTGYEVADLAATLDKAKAAGAEILVPAYSTGTRKEAMVKFPGGYIAEIHGS